VALLDWLHDLSFITWVRESSSQLGYTLYLAFHTIGMVALVGPTLLIAARVLGIAPRLPIKPLGSFRPLIKIGFWITMITGSVLFATAPADYVKNIVFIVKIASLAVGLACLPPLLKDFFDRTPDPDAHPISSKTRALTLVLMGSWAVGIVAGRLTAYSYVVVIESLKATFVLLAAVTAVVFLRYLFNRRAPVRERAFQIDIQPVPAKGGK
jgi:hypothetical protein